jgi:flagellar hook-associated protein 2
VLTSRFFGAGPVQSFEELGVSLNSQGNLDFDEDKFREKYGASPENVERFFTTASLGASAKLVSAAQRLSGPNSSILLNRATALQRTIDNQERQISAMNTTLERQREQMVKQFAQLEIVVSRMQTNLSWLSRIQPIPFTTSRSQ